MSRVIKFQAPFERLKLYVEADVALRKAVIMQAIIDATNISNNKAAKKLELEAKAWLFGSSNEFTDTCIEAEMEPAFVVRLAKELILLHSNNARSKVCQARFRKNSMKDNPADDQLKESNIEYA